MVGFLNAHGTSPCIFGGEFLDLSIVHDDERPRGKVGVLELPDNDDSLFATTEEPFDYDFEEIFWSSLMLGADYDWDDAPEETPAEWVARRYADVIQLNEQFGYVPASNVVSFAPSFIGQSRNNIRSHHWSERKSLRHQNPNRDHLRGKAHAK